MNERQVTIICVSILAVLVLGGGGTLYYLEFHTIAELNKQIAIQRKKVKEAEGKVAQIPRLKTENEAMEKEIEVQSARIPTLHLRGRWNAEKKEWEFEYDNLSLLLDELRRKANVYIGAGRFSVMPRTAGPGQEPLPENVHKIAYDFNVKGGWFNLLRYINMLETHKRVLGIETFSIIPGGESDRPGAAPKRDLTIRVVSYTYRDPVSPAPPEAGPTAPPVDPTGPKPEKQPETTKSTLPPE